MKISGALKRLIKYGMETSTRQTNPINYRKASDLIEKRNIRGPWRSVSRGHNLEKTRARI